jgi:hypothetical protein
VERLKYKCSNCGEMHEEWSAIGFDAPDNFYNLSDEERDRYVKEKNDDFCVIEYEDQTDRFIRAVWFQKVVDHCEDLHYGVWVSLSEKSFNDYKENFSSEDHEGVYFGYLSTQIPGYDYNISIKTNVVLSGNSQRPEVIPHQDQMQEVFVRDYWNGITKQEAEKRIDETRRLGVES